MCPSVWPLYKDIYIVYSGLQRYIICVIQRYIIYTAKISLFCYFLIFLLFVIFKKVEKKIRLFELFKK